MAFAVIGAWTLADRSLLLVDVLRDRGALYRETAEGTVENAYTLKLMNLVESPRSFVVEVTGLPGIRIVGEREFHVEAGSILPRAVTVSVPAESGLHGIQPVAFRIHAIDEPSRPVLEKSSFVLP